MSDNLRRYTTIRQSLLKLYPGEIKGNPARRLRTLAALISGIVGSSSYHFSRIAEHVVDSDKEESRIKKISPIYKERAH